jgi:hypothetical protein
MSVFETLNDVADEETDVNKKPVIESSKLVFPRNIIYNKYLNRHEIFFIENSDFDPANPGNFVENWNGYAGKNILCADGDENKPIIAVRASSGGEQEIHLMVVNRSPFDAVVNGVNLSDYYTTFYPTQDFYPTDANGKKLDTYINFLTNDASKTKTRAEEFASKLKSYDSDKLGKYIFLKYKAEEKITFKDNEGLEKALMKWIKTSVEKSAEEKEETWTKTWNEYIDKLVRQNSERKKLVPEACRIAFKHANDTLKADNSYKKVSEVLSAAEQAEAKALLMAEGYTSAEADTKLAEAIHDWFKKEGGLCNDGKAHL